MGVKLAGWLRPNTQRNVRTTISRADLVRFIEEAIGQAELDETNPALASQLRSVAQNNRYIAANTWGVRTVLAEKPLCGCPLTEAGVIDLVDTPGNEADKFNQTRLNINLSRFYISFDNKMTARFGRESMLLRVTD